MEIVSVEVLENFVVRLGFADGFERTVDLEPYLCGPVLRKIRSDPTYFRRVRVDPDARTIVWPNGADLAPDTLYLGVPSARME